MSEVLACFSECPIEPVGYRMIVGQLPPQKKVGSIVIPEGTDTRAAQELLVSVSQIVKLGPLCYEAEHFSTFEERRLTDRQLSIDNGVPIISGYNQNPRRWVNVGDWVLHGTNAGQRVPLETNGERVIYRVLNDDEIHAVIPEIETLRCMMPLLTYDLTA